MKKSNRIKIVSLILIVFTMIQLLSMSGISAATTTPNRVSIEIPTGKQAVYTAKITRGNTDKVALKLGDAEIFSITSGAMKIFGSHVQGKYGEGEYLFTARINPAQKMVSVELVIPNGGIIRRGSSMFAEDYATMSVAASKTYLVSDVDIRYEDVSVAEYTILETEPTGNNRIYNISLSFSDAATNRLLAWTAAKGFIGNSDMVVKYREKGTSEWLSVVATRTKEGTEVADEDYFKAEISGLKPDTAYEYQIGKKDGTASNQWSDVYSFTTAKENIDEFSFIAIGDTQGYEWNHFKYAKAALDEAYEVVTDPAFILHTGDVVDSGYQASQWNRYFRSVGTYSTNIANFVAIGNHDTRNDKDVQKNDNKNNYFSFHFNHPDADADAMVMDPAVYDKLSASGKVQVDNFNETIYSYDYGNAHFIVLNTGTYVNTGNETYIDDKPIIEAQRAWLEKDLEANKDATWKIIVVHEAMYHKNGAKQDRKYLTDIIENYGVDLVIEGHSHLVTRSYPMKNGEIVTKTSPDVIEKGTGTVYMTIGATTPSHSEIGASTVEALQNIVYSDNTQPAYTTVTIKGNRLVLTTKQIDGFVLDKFVIKPAGEPDEEFGDDFVSDVETNVPDVSDNAADSAQDGESAGCGATVSVAGFAMVAILGACTAFVAKKKED